MSQEKVFNTLENLGLSKPDAQVYIFLGKKGPQKGKDIAKALKMPKQQLYLVLKNLQSKGIVNATLEHPSKFSALPFEKTLDLFVKAKMEEAQRIDGDKKEILSDWQSIAISETGDQSPKFTVLEGRNYIYPRLKLMIEDTKSQLSIISTIPGLVRADQFGLLEAAFNHASKTGTNFRFLTEVSKENLKATKMLLEKMPKPIARIEGRTPDLDFKLISRMLIRDDAEAAFFVGQEVDKTAKDTDEVCLWTNSNPIVNSFKAVFEDLWHNSTDIQKRVIEIETGIPATKTYVIGDPEASRKKYDGVLGAAKKEIFMVTSSVGLVEASRNIAQLKGSAEKNVSVKIMAPIIGDNLEAALQLSECCRVKHIPKSHIRTTIIDGKHLFQFKNSSDQENQNNTNSFENTFYTDESDYVEKTRNMLDDTWKHAISPSEITVKQLIKPPNPTSAPVSEEEYTVSRKDSAYQKMIIGVEEKPGEITEEYVLNKIINAKRDRRIKRYYGSSATAVIHPPSNFNLPNMLLTFYHCNKQSYFGAEDYMIVYVWIETPNGYAYVPVAIVGDNKKGMQYRKMSYAGTPAIQNCHILKKDELEIETHGNTLFAGWTVPIPLVPPYCVLPASSLLFEGYGKIKTAVIKFTMPSGATSIVEGNGLDAFVTFFHPESKYAGPGTDGIFSRDFVLTTYSASP